MNPVKPSEIKAIIIDPSDPPCVAWSKFLKAVYLFYKIKRYENSASGGIGAQHGADICAAANDCPPAITTT